MISEKKSGAPYLNVWFGNFYRPAYDDEAFVAEGMEPVSYTHLTLPTIYSV